MARVAYTLNDVPVVLLKPAATPRLEDELQVIKSKRPRKKLRMGVRSTRMVGIEEFASRLHAPITHPMGASLHGYNL